MEKSHSIRKAARQKPIPQGLSKARRRQMRKRLRKQQNQGLGAPIGDPENWV